MDELERIQKEWVFLMSRYTFQINNSLADTF